MGYIQGHSQLGFTHPGYSQTMTSHFGAENCFMSPDHTPNMFNGVGLPSQVQELCFPITCFSLMRKL